MPRAFQVILVSLLYQSVCVITVVSNIPNANYH
jgi:hypothetical protein